MTPRGAGAPTPRERPSRLPLLLRPLGGLLVVSGPPLGGKGPLAASLHERLPGSEKVEVADNLANGSGDASDERPLLSEARARLARALGSSTPVVIMCARFATSELRAEAARTAEELQVRFLLVEASSSSLRSMERLSRLLLTADETAARLARYENALRAYQRVSLAERRRLPAICLSGVLGDLEGATARAVAAWVAR